MDKDDRSLNIVGESYRNTDGSSRQLEIARCRPGDRIELRREPNNRYDTSAVAVHSGRGVQIGYLSAEHARWMSGKIDKGDVVRAIVERVNGGEPGKPSRGVLIRVNYNGEEPTLPVLRRGWLARLFGGDR